MKKYIDDLKTRSYAEKSNIAFFASLAITGLIAGLWFFTIFSNPAEYFDTPEQNEIQNLANTGSLFDVIKEGFK